MERFVKERNENGTIKKKGTKPERSSWRPLYYNRTERFKKSRNVPSPTQYPHIASNDWLHEDILSCLVGKLVPRTSTLNTKCSTRKITIYPSTLIKEKFKNFKAAIVNLTHSLNIDFLNFGNPLVKKKFEQFFMFFFHMAELAV